MILDFHTHVFPPSFRENRQELFSDKPFETLYRSPKSTLAGVEDLLRRMDEEEIEKSVIFGFPWEDPETYRRHNDYILESVLRSPDRLIGFGCFSLHSPGGPVEAERCLAGGLSGVGELASYGTGLTPDLIQSLGEVLEVCSRFDVPLLLHTNEPVGHAYPGKAPMELSQVYGFVKRFPNNRIVLAHFGGGLLFYGLMKKEVKEVLRNVWFDTAASPFLYGPEIYRISGEIIGFDKLLFGSDYPLLRAKRYSEEMSLSGISPSDVKKIMGENALRLLRLL
jgi:uncharacterized protein